MSQVTFNRNIRPFRIAWYFVVIAIGCLIVYGGHPYVAVPVSIVLTSIDVVLKPKAERQDTWLR